MTRRLARGCKRPSESGFAIIFAVSVVAALMAGALVTLTQAGNYAQIVGASSSRQRLTSISDAGVTFGKNDLFQKTHPLGPTGPLSSSGLQLMPRVPQNHVLCTDGANCNDFFFLTQNQAFDAGNYTVAATCFPQNCSIPDNELVGFEMRVLSTLPNGAQRLVEVSYMP